MLRNKKIEKKCILYYNTMKNEKRKEKHVNLELCKKLCQKSKILWTQHCLQRMQERDISRADVKNGIATGEIIEDYPDTKKFEDDLKTRRKR